MNSATLRVARYLSRRIKNGSEMMKEFPQHRDEYLEETIEYSRILYQILKEAIL